MFSQSPADGVLPSYMDSLGSFTAYEKYGHSRSRFNSPRRARRFFFLTLKAGLHGVEIRTPTASWLHGFNFLLMLYYLLHFDYLSIPSLLLPPREPTWCAQCRHPSTLSPSIGIVVSYIYLFIRSAPLLQDGMLVSDIFYLHP